MKKVLLLIAAVAVFACTAPVKVDLSKVETATSEDVKRVEPLNWWVGMETPLQLMIYGSHLSDSEVAIVNEDGAAVKGISVEEVHNADSANYLFVDINVAANAAPGQYWIVLAKDGIQKKFAYSFEKRADGSRERTSYTVADAMYLLMPDRFANGDPENDSSDDTREKANYTHPFGRHGGDIQGIIDHLDYLEDLGITALWTTPLLLDDEKFGTYHGYACADYYRIDPRYGTNELYREFVEKAREKGIMVVMDFVLNHCGTAHWWNGDLPFADWYNVWPEFTRSNYAMSSHSDPHASKHDHALCINGWFDTSMPDMNMTNPYVLNYLTQASVWWIEYSGINGLRIDTYPYNEKVAVAEWTENVLREYPNLSIVGECWFHEPDLIAYWEGKKMNTDGYTSHLPRVMDFPLCEAVWESLNWNGAYGGPMRKVYDIISKDFNYADTNDLMTFLANHDTTRSGDMAQGDPDKMKVALTLLCTMRGMPQIYVGDELLVRSDDPRGGDGAMRVDFQGGFPENKANWFTREGRTPVQNELHDLTKSLLALRKECTALQSGKLLHFMPVNGLYVYFRYNDDEKVMVILNGASSKNSVRWEDYTEILPLGQTGKLLSSSEEITSGNPLEVGPMSANVIIFR